MRHLLIAAPLLAILAAVLPGGAWGQGAPASLSPRVDKLEKEMRAVQRKVFPGADPRFFEPEIAPPAAGPVAGLPATSPIADLTGRVNALEQEMARLTGQVEQNGFKLRQLEEALAKLKGDTEHRLGLIEGGAAPAGSAPKLPVQVPSTSPAPAAPAPSLAPPPAAPPPPAPPAETSSGDPGEGAYMAGYRLWADKKYPQAIEALQAMLAKYPKHRRASYAQNLIGRAYLDDGKPAAAAEAFYANYQKMPRGERAPDSLYFLGQALTRLKKPAEACKVYDELQDVYGAKIAEPLKGRVAQGRVEAKCG